MTRPFISPLYDTVFTHVFGDQRNIANTRNFLKTLLDIPENDFDRLTIKNSVMKPAFRLGKTGIVDLRLNTKSGRIIHIEMQVEKTNNLRSRILYYAARLLADQLKRREDYSTLHQVISILICNHELLEEESSYINEYVLRNKGNSCFTDLLKIVILELPKVPEMEDSPVWPWLQFLKSKSVEDYKMLVKKHPEMKQATICAQKYTLGERLRWTLFDLEMRRRDEREWKNYVLEQAQKQAQEQAEAQAKVHAKEYAEAYIKEQLEIRFKEQVEIQVKEQVEEAVKEELRNIAEKMKLNGISSRQIEIITGIRQGKK